MMKTLMLSIVVLGAALALNTPAGGGAVANAGLNRTDAASVSLDVLVRNQSALKVFTRVLSADALELTAIADAGPMGKDMPMKFVLRSGEELAFALPGQPQKLYTFTHRIQSVEVTESEIVFSQVALAD